jgi:hypothetical protein
VVEWELEESMSQVFKRRRSSGFRLGLLNVVALSRLSFRENI